jgi:hypothetical protein
VAYGYAHTDGTIVLGFSLPLDLPPPSRVNPTTFAAELGTDFICSLLSHSSLHARGCVRCFPLFTSLSKFLCLQNRTILYRRDPIDVISNILQALWFVPRSLCRNPRPLPDTSHQTSPFTRLHIPSSTLINSRCFWSREQILIDMVFFILQTGLCTGLYV